VPHWINYVIAAAIGVIVLGGGFLIIKYMPTGWHTAAKIGSDKQALTVNWRHRGDSKRTWTPQPPDDRLLSLVSHGPLDGNPPSPRRHPVSDVSVAEDDGARVTIFNVDLLNTTAAGWSRMAFVKFASVGMPPAPARLAIYKLDGYRAFPIYRRVSKLWRYQTGNPDFDRAFFVNAKDRSFARQILTPEVVEWLRREQIAQQVPVILEGDALTSWLYNQDDAGSLEILADFLVEFRHILRRYARLEWSTEGLSSF
jgi:hypothetical protein